MSNHHKHHGHHHHHGEPHHKRQGDLAWTGLVFAIIVAVFIGLAMWAGNPPGNEHTQPVPTPPITDNPDEVFPPAVVPPTDNSGDRGNDRPHHRRGHVRGHAPVAPAAPGWNCHWNASGDNGVCEPKVIWSFPTPWVLN